MRKGFGQANGPAGQRYSGTAATTNATLVGNDLCTDRLGKALAALPKDLDVSVQRVLRRRRRRSEGGLKRGQGELISSEGSSQGMFAQLFDDVSFPQQDARLRATQELIAAGKNDVGAVA